MELEIDYSITSRFGDYHDFYVRNLKIFKSVVKIFENYFKKEKYQNSEIKIDDDAKDKATITFCSRKYQIGLFIEPTNLNYAAILLSKMNEDQWVPIWKIAVDHAENITFPDKTTVSLKDNYEFNNAVLNFFIDGITKNNDERTATL